jgi:hypothetical protein
MGKLNSGERDRRRAETLQAEHRRATGSRGRDDGRLSHAVGGGLPAGQASAQFTCSYPEVLL